MSIKKKPALAATILFILPLIFSGCVQKPKVQKIEKLTIAFQNWIGYGPFYLAQEKGFFRDEGLELVFIDEQLDSARRDAFKEGMLDCEAGTIDLLVSKRAQDIPIVAVMELDRSFGADAIVATENIKSLGDLVGQRIAFARDDVGETFLSYLFFKNNLPFEKLIIVPKGVEDAADAFINKEASAVVTWEPWVSKALQRPGSHILISSKDYPGVIIDTLNIREDIVKAQPEIVRGLMRGWFKAVKFYQEHPSEASQAIAKYYKISPQKYQQDAQGLQWVGYAQQAQPAQYGQWLEVFNAISEIKFRNNRIFHAPDAKSAINQDLLKRLYENSN